MNSLVILTLCLVAGYASASGVLGGAVLHGPSGSIVSNGVAHGATVIGPTGVSGLGLGLGLGHGAVIAGPAAIGLGHGLGLGLGLGHGLVGSGIEGQWIPDINEQLHDDGSYKPHIYGH